MMDAATCCARLSGARFVMDACSAKSSRFSTRWSVAVRDQMKDAYPELVESAERVAHVIEIEETRFARTLSEGLKRLDEDLSPLVAAKQEHPEARATYSGEKAFKLYDTFRSAAGLHG